MRNAHQAPTIGLAQRLQRLTASLGSLLWYIGILAAIVWGWLNRDQGLLTAESGMGYALGIIGSCLMLLLLVYSLRKRWKLLRRFLTVKVWFQLHMTLGILGPLAILFHCNFRLASLNSTVAMICMLLVVFSGFIGRYLYIRLHHGLYGKKIKVNQILKHFSTLENDILRHAILEKQQTLAKKLFAAIQKIADDQSVPKGFWGTYKNMRQAKKIARGLNRLVRHMIIYHQQHTQSPQALRHIQKTLRNDNTAMLEALNKITRLQVSERLFSLWHVAHIPIFILMIISVLVHILIVHMY